MAAVTEEFSLVCLSNVGADKVGKAGTEDRLTMELEKPCALPISFSTVTTHVK